MRRGKKSLSYNMINEGLTFTVTAETVLQMCDGLFTDGKTRITQLMTERLLKYGKN